MSTEYFVNEGKRLAYTDQGQGEVVLLVPGLGDLKESYRFLVPGIVQAGFRAVCLDVRGHGESDAEWDDYSVEGVGKDIVALLGHLGATGVHYVGNSMAAGAGVWAVVEHPELFRSTVMIGPFYQGATPLFMKMLLAPMFWRPWGVALWLKYYASLFPTGKPADFVPYLARMRAVMREPGRLKATTRMMFASKESSGSRVRQFAKPSLVVMGSRDPDFKSPSQDAAKVAADLGGAFEIIEGAGHYPQSEFPHETLAVLLSFWRGLGR